MLLCDASGLVGRSIDGRGPRVGESLFEEIAGSSHGPLRAVLQAAESAASRACVERSGGEVCFLAAANAGEWLLLVGAPSRSRVAEAAATLLASEPHLREAARKILELEYADAATARLWDELSRLNNDLVNAQRELAERNARLERLNAQKNELLGMAAHDLRAPLGVIRAFAESLAEDRRAPEEDRRFMLERIQRNAAFMAALVDDVLDLSAIESGTVKLNRVDLEIGELIGEAAEHALITVQRKRVGIELQGAASPIHISADRRKLLQVAGNLLTNAVKFSPDGGAPVCVTWGADGGTVFFRVTDRGIGIAGDVARLFRPFGNRNGHGDEQGTGLGLAISKRIVEAHGGSITIESEPGSGTSVTVRIPRTVR